MWTSQMMWTQVPATCSWDSSTPIHFLWPLYYHQDGPVFGRDQLMDEWHLREAESEHNRGYNDVQRKAFFSHFCRGRIFSGGTVFGWRHNPSCLIWSMFQECSWICHWSYDLKGQHPWVKLSTISSWLGDCPILASDLALVIHTFALL